MNLAQNQRKSVTIDEHGLYEPQPPSQPQLLPRAGPKAVSGANAIGNLMEKLDRDISGLYAEDRCELPPPLERISVGMASPTPDAYVSIYISRISQGQEMGVS